MPQLTKQEILNVVPGESMTKEKGILPFEKPPLTSSPDEGIQMVFDAITEPQAALKLVRTLELGVPIDQIVDSMMMMLHGEGIVPPQALPIMGPAIAAMIEGMAKLAGAPINYTEVQDPWTKPDEDRIDKLVAKMTGELVESAGSEEASEEASEGVPEEAPEADEGLMTRPEADEGIM